MADDEFTQRRALDRAGRARALADDPLLQESLDLYEASLMEAWHGSAANDTASRERIWALMQASRKMRQHLSALIDDGKVAKAMLDAMQAGNAA